MTLVQHPGIKTFYMAQVVTSKQYTVNVSDLLKGLIVAIVAPVIASIQDMLSTGKAAFNWRLIGITALSAGVAYLAKNFFSPATTIISKQSPAEIAAIKPTVK